MAASRVIPEEILRDVRDAPPVLKRMAALIGWRKTALFGLAFASTRVYVPKGGDLVGHPLAWCVGHDAARRLAESEFAGRQIEVPRYFKKKVLCRRIVEGAKAGIPTSVLASHNNLSLSAVQKIIARAQ